MKDLVEYVVVRPYEPLVIIEIMAVHVFDHLKGLFLRRVNVVDSRQTDDREIVAARDSVVPSEKDEFPGHVSAPGAPERRRPRTDKILGRHDGDEDQSFLLGAGLLIGSGNRKRILAEWTLGTTMPVSHRNDERNVHKDADGYADDELEPTVGGKDETTPFHVVV